RLLHAGVGDARNAPGFRRQPVDAGLPRTARDMDEPHQSDDNRECGPLAGWAHGRTAGIRARAMISHKNVELSYTESRLRLLRALAMVAKTRYFVIVSLLVLGVGLGTGLVAYYVGFPAGAFTRAGGPEELQYVPRTATVVAYANVNEIMA